MDNKRRSQRVIVLGGGDDVGGSTSAPVPGQARERLGGVQVLPSVALATRRMSLPQQHYTLPLLVTP